MKMLDENAIDAILTLTSLNIIHTSPSEPHTLSACFFQRECARTITIVNVLGSQNTPQISLKHLQGDL